MKKLWLLWILIGSYQFGFSQIITIRDQDTGQPLELATLSSNEPTAFAISNAAGQADITEFRGAQLIEIRLMGYQTETRSYFELEQSQFRIALSSTNISLDQVVVSATRWNQSKRDIPSKIISIIPRDVALQNPQTAADMLGASGEVFIQKSQQGGGSPMIRGFSTNRLLYTVDGVRMNTAIFRSGNLQNVISLDPFAVEQAEVFFGPGSIIYGSDAIGGVMSFQTITPQLSITDHAAVSGKVAGRYASANNEKTGHFDVNVGSKKWAFVSSYSSNDFGDLRMGAYGPDDYLKPFYVSRQDGKDVAVANDDPLRQRPTGYSQINMMQKIRFQANEKWDFQYGFHYSSTSNYSRYDRLIRTRSNGQPRSAEWYYGPQIWMMNALQVTHNAQSAVYDQMTIRLAHQLFEESRHDRDFNAALRFNRFEKVKAWSANVDFIKSIGQKQTLFYGLEAVTDDVVSTGTDEDITTGDIIRGPSRYPQATWSSYAAYLNYQYKLSPKTTLQAGARYNRFSLDADFTNNLDFYPFPFATAKIDNGALTGSLGVVFNPSEKWTISANAATGFRAPNVDDVGKVFDSEPGSVVIPNPGLQAEYAYNAEIGMARIFGKSVKIDLTGYYTILDNAMVRRDFTLNGQDSIIYDGNVSGVQAIQNAAVANVYGIQAGLEIKLPAGFGFSTQFNYQKGEEELDNGETSPSRHAAPWFGISRITYKASKLNLQFYAAYSGEVSYENLSEEGRGTAYLFALDADGNPYSPSWYTLNVKALYQITDNLSASVGLENLTDQRYRPYSSGVTASGRNFILSLRTNF